MTAGGKVGMPDPLGRWCDPTPISTSGDPLLHCCVPNTSGWFCGTCGRDLRGPRIEPPGENSE